MKGKQLDLLKFMFEHSLFGTKALLAFLTWLFGSLVIGYLYFVLDLISTLYKHYQDKNYQDLSLESFESLKSSNKKLQGDFDKMAVSQQRYEREREVKEHSLKLLNKLIAEGLIREKDLLSLAGTTGFFQLFVYSASLSKQVTTLGLERLQRQYPGFLESLGFVRLGKNSTYFLINKNHLEDKKLKDIRSLKRFLMYHFSKIRRTEWRIFLQKVKETNRREYLKLKTQDFKKRGYLKYNFLLTETNMNPTNIGFVDDEYVGLGVVSKSGAINSQILERANVNRLEVNRELKVKIRKIIEKMDISLLLDGIAKKDKDKIDLKQDILRRKLGVGRVIDFYKINISDLSRELQSIGLPMSQAKKISEQIIDTTKIYVDALNELNISI